MSNRTSFGTRILAVLMLVAVTATLCAWGVGALLAPGIFHDHLDMVGLSQDSAEAAHMEEAFQSSMMVSWAVALAVSLVLSLVVSGYIARRLLRSLSPVTESVREIAGGNYGSRVARPGIGREFDDLVTSFNELARRLDASALEGPVSSIYAIAGTGGSAGLIARAGETATVVVRTGDYTCNGGAIVGAPGTVNVLVADGDLTLGGSCRINGSCYLFFNLHPAT